MISRGGKRILLRKMIALRYAKSTHDEAPRSSLLRRSSHFGYEGRKLLDITELKQSEMPETFGGASASAAG